MTLLDFLKIESLRHTLSCHHSRMRVIQYSRDARDGTDKPRRTGSLACAGDDDRSVSAIVGPSRRGTLQGRVVTRSVRLTNFWHCGFEHFSSRTGLEARPRLTNRQWFWPRIGLPKGLAMLVRSCLYGVHGKAAFVAGPEAIPAASLPTRLLGGLLLLICP